MYHRALAVGNGSVSFIPMQVLLSLSSDLDVTAKDKRGAENIVV